MRLLLQLAVLLATRIHGDFTLDLSCNWLLPETLPIIVSWLEKYPLLRVDLAVNSRLIFKQDLWPLLNDKQVTQ